MTKSFLAFLLVFSQVALAENDQLRIGATLPKSIDKDGGAADVVLDHKYFQLSYNAEHFIPNWVNHILEGKNLRNSSSERPRKFILDHFLSRLEIEQIDSRGYRGTGYDRGHLAPAADFPFSQEAMDSTFVVSNVAPQRPELNQKAWLMLESRVRRFACGEGKIQVVSGPILNDSLPRLKSGISIPRKFFKALYSESGNHGRGKSIAFVYDQDDSKDVYKDRAMSVRALEAEIHFNLFPHLEKEKDNIESTYDLSQWNEKTCAKQTD